MAKTFFGVGNDCRWNCTQDATVHNCIVLAERTCGLQPFPTFSRGLRGCGATRVFCGFPSCLQRGEFSHGWRDFSLVFGVSSVPVCPIFLALPHQCTVFVGDIASVVIGKGGLH